MHDDVQLLRAYAESGSEASFRELVERRIGLVYGIALRRVGGDAHLAQDVAATVFRDLARKAKFLAQREELSGWLFVSTRYAASDVVRSERRRRVLSERYARMAEPHENPATMDPSEHLRPVLDEALEHLRDSERQALLLRFYEGRNYADLGRRLNLSENGARMRVDRALEKLRESLGRRGVSSTAAALAVVLPLHAQAVAPAGLSAAVAGTAMAAGSAGTGGILFKIMSLSKLQLTAGAAIIVLAAAGITEVTAQASANRTLANKVAQLEASGGDAGAAEATHASLLRQVSALRASATASAIRNAAQDSSQPASATRVKRYSQRFHSLSEALAAAPLFEIAQEDVKPTAIDQGRPTFPVEPRKEGTGGTVVVDFVVGPDGDVYGARALSSSDARFTDSAVNAVSRWLFKPGLKDAAPVNTHMQVPIVYKMNNGI